MDWVLKGADALIDGALRRVDVTVSGGRIAGAAAPGAQVLDLSGLWLLPGIVDLHGDAIERIIMPRPGVSFPLDLSLAEADRQMLGNGITTAFHGLTVGWEPGLRNIVTARTFVTALRSMQDSLSCDTRINFRWEIFALDQMDELAEWLARMPGAVLSLNDHTTANLGLPPDSRKIRRMAERSGLAPEACVSELAAIAARAPEVPGAVSRMVNAARTAGLTCLSHDETTPAERAANRALGVTVSEFPMTRETALAAREADEAVIFGAPNVLRGGSQNDAVNAAPAMVEGLGTILASDYWYPAPLLAAFTLAERYGMPFSAAWACVSTHPAAAAGFGDRGRLEEGLRADIVALCPRTRRVHSVWVAGDRKLARA